MAVGQGDKLVRQQVRLLDKACRASLSALENAAKNDGISSPGTVTVPDLLPAHTQPPSFAPTASFPPTASPPPAPGPARFFVRLSILMPVLNPFPVSYAIQTQATRSREIRIPPSTRHPPPATPLPSLPT